MPDIDASTLAYLELGPDVVLSSVEALGYDCDGHLLALNSYENRVYRIGIEDSEPIVAKFYRPGRWTDAQIMEEHAFALELAEHEIPVVPPLSQDGLTLHHLEGFRVALYECRGGRPPDLEDPLVLEQLGRLTARIHLCGEIEPFRERPRVDPASYGVASRDFLLAGGFIPADLEVAYTSVCEHVLERVDMCYSLAGDVVELRLHADFHPGNVLASGEVLHLFDFDDSRMGPAIQDLWMFLSGTQDDHRRQLMDLVEGYEEFREFNHAELHLIEALRSLRLMHYAGWLASRWQDPAFKAAFPWFNSQRYWEDHILSLREQIALMEEEPPRLMP